MTSDVFSADADAIGNWPAVLGVLHQGNAILEGGAGGTVGRWVGEILGPGSEATPLVADFENDTSGSSFGGDYTRGPSSAIPPVPTGLAPYPVDQLGRTVPNDGTGVAGALQRT